jgi:D-lactate dehydrogenase
MSIHFFEITEQERRYLEPRLPGEDLVFHPETLANGDQAAAIAESAEIVSVFVHSHVGPDVIDQLPNLKAIVTRSTGYDHINVPAAESADIPVFNVPTYGENTVAEHTFALILALSRNLRRAYAQAASGDFSLDGLQGFDLKGKTIGVVGTGHIGLHVIRIARGFGMTILATDPKHDNEAADLLGFTYTSLKDLLNRSDIVTLHAPLIPQTRHLIGGNNIAEFKRGALLINTARGALVDTCTLIQALDDGTLSGAGLDVIEGEEIISEEKELLRSDDAPRDTLKLALMNRELLRRPDLVITPHIAFYSREAVERILDTTVANILGARSGSSDNRVRS